METLDIVDDGGNDLRCNGPFKFSASRYHYKETANLNGGGASADDGEPLAAVVVAVVPAGRVERCAFEPRSTGELGDLEGMPEYNSRT